MQVLRDIFFIAFGIAFLAVVILFGVIGMFCLVLATYKYDWMIAHEMFKHAYVFAGLSIFGEVVYLFMMRHGIVLLMGLFADMFSGNKK